MTNEGAFWRYDLKFEIKGIDRPMVRDHQPGQHFLMQAENLISDPGWTFPL